MPRSRRNGRRRAARSKSPGRSAAGVERPDVELVDDELVAGRHLERVVAPVEGGRVVDDGVADRARDLPGVRVDAARPRRRPRSAARNRYSSPGSTPSTSADHVPPLPSPSRASAVASGAQSSKLPGDDDRPRRGGPRPGTCVPPRYGSAPIPGRGDGATALTWRAASCRRRSPAPANRPARHRRPRRPAAASRSPSSSDRPSG